MKAKLLITLLTASLLLAACGRKAEDTPTTDPVPTEAPADAEEAADAADTTRQEDSSAAEAEEDDPDQGPEEADPSDDEDPDAEDPALTEPMEDAGDDNASIQDPDELDDELPDYLSGDMEPTVSDGSDGTGEGAGNTAGGVYEASDDLSLNAYPSDPITVESAKGRYTIDLTSAKTVEKDGLSCLEISFSYTNEAVSSAILIDTLNLTLTDETGLILQTVAEDNPSLATLTPAEVGDTRSFTVKYYLSHGAESVRLIYTDVNDNTTAGWEIRLKGL